MTDSLQKKTKKGIPFIFHTVKKYAQLLREIENPRQIIFIISTEELPCPFK